MNIKEAIQQRHSVRAYDDRPITGEDLEKLEALIRECNEESGLHIQLVTDEPKAFQSRLALWPFHRCTQLYRHGRQAPP